MVDIATQVHNSAPRGPFPPLATPCSYSTAIDTVGDNYRGASHPEFNH